MKYLFSAFFLLLSVCDTYSMEKKKIEVGSRVKGVCGAPVEGNNMCVRIIVNNSLGKYFETGSKELIMIKEAIEACEHEVNNAWYTNVCLLHMYWNNNRPDGGETYFVTTHGLPMYVHSSWVELEEE